MWFNRTPSPVCKQSSCLHEEKMVRPFKFDSIKLHSNFFSVTKIRDGDLYAALRDCLKALKVDKGHAKAHLRLCRCLLELKWVDEAQGALELFKSRFAEHASGAACVALAKDISDVIRDMSSSESAASKAAEPMPSLEDDLSSSKYFYSDLPH